MACKTMPNLPPKNKIQNVNLASDISAEMTAPISVSSEPSLLVPPQKPTQVTQPITFDQLIAKIDSDIHCFDRVAPEQQVPKGNQPDLTTSQHNRPNISKVPFPKNKPAEPIKASPLSDSTNNSQTQITLDSASERKWTWIQRPNLISNDESLETSLGKRGPLPNLEDSTPQKRLATKNDDIQSSSSQTVVAGQQPR